MIQENSIEIVSVVLAAGESRLFALSGEYFEIIDAPSPIDVVLSDFNGAQRARMNQASASFYSKGVQYGVIQITSASAQTVRFAYGSGETGTRRATGSVTISGAVALDAPTLAALESVDLNAASINQLNRPLASTGNFKSSVALAANTPETIFTAAANVNGAILLSYGWSTFSSAGSGNAILAKATAPASNIDGELYGTSTSMIASASNLEFASNGNAQFVAAGLGLYFISPGSLTVGGPRFARFRLL